MTIAKAKAWANKIFIVETSLTFVTYDHQNNFLIQPTGQRFRSTQAQAVKMLIVAKSTTTLICINYSLKSFIHLVPNVRDS